VERILFLNEEERMNKKLLIFCLALAIAVWSMPAYAAKVMGTWEDTQGDGWKHHGAGTYITLPITINSTNYSQSTIGATNGTYSIAVNPPSGLGQFFAKENWKNTGAPNYYGYASMTDILANTKFCIDVTYDSGSWPSDTSYAQVYQLSMQTNTYGWNDVGGSAAHTGANGVVFSDTLNPGYTGGLPLVNPGTPGTVITGTWTWDYSAILPGGSWTGNHISTADTWMNIIFNMQSNVSGTYYFDNARFIPEPATIALLGLGGLALLRRKRA